MLNCVLSFCSCLIVSALILTLGLTVSRFRVRVVGGAHGPVRLASQDGRRHLPPGGEPQEPPPAE